MPYDGTKLHEQEGLREVRSSSGQSCWVWDWDKSIWFLDTSRGQRGLTKPVVTNSNDIGDTETDMDETPASELDFSNSDDETTASETDVSNSNDEASINEAWSQIEGRESVCNSNPRTSKRMRDGKNAEHGPVTKHFRGSDPEAPLGKSACHHRCTDWCLQGYTDQEALYAEAWQNFVDTQQAKSTSNDNKVV
ncbi:hypothetical protein PMIN06_012020 [Paraphaeosphaeria minitans]|uniref:Uncharacterized protein n=1 Tax=Paraphaeosphaeria minitans TaxID=565426 RepID=A0A9P6KKJ5_9PLEO|nr:hypothetical protein PMIN01_12550 [Paraphaeosphaeria minitans]